MITKVNPANQIVDENRRPTRQLQDFLVEVQRLGIITGDGSPDGVVEASQTQLYMDEGVTGITGAILYIKKQADIGGDRTLGWILI